MKKPQTIGEAVAAMAKESGNENYASARADDPYHRRESGAVTFHVNEGSPVPMPPATRRCRLRSCRLSCRHTTRQRSPHVNGSPA